jgi:glycosyltransferase involved in cell wall biosynthesis
MKKVAIVYHYIAHYRLPIFKELANISAINFQFYSGIETDQKINIVNAKTLSNEGINCFELQNRWFLKNKFLWQKNLIQELISNDYDTVIFLGNPNFLSTWAALFFCKIKGIKTILWTHGYTRKLNFIKILIFKIYWMLADKIFLYGNFAKVNLIKLGVDANKLVVIYNSLNYQYQLAIRNNLTNTDVYKSRFKNNYPVLIFVGRLTKNKKLDQILQAQKLLLAQDTVFNLVLVGKGEDENRLKEFATSNGLIQHCWFYGETFDEIEIANLFFNSNLCVSPGNVGLTAMHSLVYGIPVITHNNFNNQMPEFESIISGDTGEYFEENNIENLSFVLKQWLNLTSTNTSEIRLNCYRIIDKYYNPAYQKEQILAHLK